MQSQTQFDMQKSLKNHLEILKSQDEALKQIIKDFQKDHITLMNTHEQLKKDYTKIIKTQEKFENFICILSCLLCFIYAIYFVGFHNLIICVTSLICFIIFVINIKN